MQLKEAPSFVQHFQQLYTLFCNETLIHALVTECIREKITLFINYASICTDLSVVALD